VLEFVEEALDEVALAVDAAADRPLDQTRSRRWNVRPGSGGADEGQKRVGVVAAVGDDVTALQSSQQLRRSVEIVRLARREHEPHRQTVFIHQRVDLGAQSPARTADGVIFAPFFPPAACWWARMMELSINAMEWGDFAASVSKIRTQTPAFAQRL